MMNFNKHLLLPVLAILLIAGCRRKDSSSGDEEIGDAAQVLSSAENDTIPMIAITPGLRLWLAYYVRQDSAFLLRNFRASGVSLHMDVMPDAIIRGNEGEFSEWFDYSPDSSYFLDLVSYNNLVENGKLLPGEADQQVTLGDVPHNARKQLMYLGPSQLAEFADWTGKGSFLIGIASRTENNDSLQAEIFFFSLPDSSFTNFRLNHHIPLTSNGSKNSLGFSDYYFSEIKSKGSNR